MITKPEVVGFRVTTEERKAIRAVAERLSRTEGDFLRLVTLNVVRELGTLPPQDDRKAEPRQAA